jgi:hypothetical protein
MDAPAELVRAYGWVGYARSAQQRAAAGGAGEVSIPTSKRVWDVDAMEEDR